MIIGNKTYTTRYILPFLFNNKEIFCDEYGFINAYSSDINRPYLDNHVFILFEYDPSKYDHINKYVRKNKYFYDSKHIFINGVFYIEYIMVIIDNKSLINNIKEGEFSSISTEDRFKIINFWKDISYSYLKDLLKDKFDLLEIKTLEERGETVGEEDIIEDTHGSLII